MDANRIMQVAALVVASSVVLAPAPSRAEAATNCTNGSESGDNYIGAFGTCTSTGAPNDSAHPSNPGEKYDDYLFKPLCTLEGADPPAVPPVCVVLYKCLPTEVPGYLYGLTNGQWVRLQMQCRTAATATPTPALVATAFQRIPLPHLRTIAQPGTKTLVNFDTIFRVDAEPLQRNVTLLGQRVDLDIKPSSFHWTWGDGQTSTTNSPGAAYPSKAVTHRYLDADVTVDATVTVTWTARWRVNGGAWADVPGSVRTTGPAATLRVVEAIPNLAGSD